MFERIKSAVSAVVRAAITRPRLRRVVERAAASLDSVLTPTGGAVEDRSFYGRSYFEASDDSSHDVDHKSSGYRGTYDRSSSHADFLSRLITTHFSPARSLDVGTARGYVVEALRELGVDAEGCDYSVYAVNTCARGARGHVVPADLTKRLPFDDRTFDVVTAFETLEHLPPHAAAPAIAELARLSKKHVVATIPSFGPRAPLPPGWFDAKVRPERHHHYVTLGPAYDGPVPLEDLQRDVKGDPIEGHLTIASFAWWRRQFESAGLRRCDELEAEVYRALEAQGLAGLLDFYVFRHPA